MPLNVYWVATPSLRPLVLDCDPQVREGGMRRGEVLLDGLGAAHLLKAAGVVAHVVGALRPYTKKAF